MSQPIEYRQLYARMYAVRVRHGKLFTERAAEVLQRGDYSEALADLTIARSFFPDNEKLPQLIRLVRMKMKKTSKVPGQNISGNSLPKPALRNASVTPTFGVAPED